MEEWQKTGFNLPVFQIVEHLIGDAVRAVFNRPEFFHVIDIEVGDAPAFDFPSSSKFLECLDCLRELRASFSPVQKIKIDRVDSQAFETALACFWQFGA